MRFAFLAAPSHFHANTFITICKKIALYCICNSKIICSSCNNFTFTDTTASISFHFQRFCFFAAFLPFWNLYNCDSLWNTPKTGSSRFDSILATLHNTPTIWKSWEIYLLAFFHFRWHALKIGGRIQRWPPTVMVGGRAAQNKKTAIQYKPMAGLPPSVWVGMKTLPSRGR